MKYPRNTSNGHAGEFFFAYKVASVLGWPCRLFDIDIGIDAQVEVLDEERASTGKFVAFQIKTTTAKNLEDKTYVDEKHLIYWRSLETPVFVVLVVLSQKAMYLRRIEKFRNYHKTANGQVRIDFDINADRFKKSSRTLIRDAADQAALSAIREHLRSVQEGIAKIRHILARMEISPDPDDLIDAMRMRKEWRRGLDRAETLARNLGLGQSECSAAAELLETTLDDLREYMEQGGMDEGWDDSYHGDGDIKKFLEEGR